LLKFSRDVIAAAKDTLLIEGIGGVMVPLDDKRTVLDWMMALNIPLVLVTGTYVGSLSHTLTCLDVLARRGLAVKALVVNDTPGSPVTAQHTIDTLRNFEPQIPMAGMQQQPTGMPGDSRFQTIAELLEK